MARFDDIKPFLFSQILGLKRTTSDGLQIGGGINETNAKFWIDAGASKVGMKYSISAIEFINFSVSYR
jgi:hypothetical protein